MKVELKILDQRLDGVEYATPGAAAIDLRACAIIGMNNKPIPIMTAVIVRPGEVVKIGTGIAMHLGSLEADGDPWHEAHFSVAAMLLPRSGLGSRKIRLANTVGLVDADYTGEFILAVENAGDDIFIINPMDRLCQAAIVPILRPHFDVVEEFSNTTERGAGAFGSTGVA